MWWIGVGQGSYIWAFFTTLFLGTVLKVTLSRGIRYWEQLEANVMLFCLVPLNFRDFLYHIYRFFLEFTFRPAPTFILPLPPDRCPVSMSGK